MNHFIGKWKINILSVVAIGRMGTFLPAELAVRILPAQGLEGRFEYRRMMEKMMRWGIILSFCC